MTYSNYINLTWHTFSPLMHLSILSPGGEKPGQPGAFELKQEFLFRYQNPGLNIARYITYYTRGAWLKWNLLP